MTGGGFGGARSIWLAAEAQAFQRENREQTYAAATGRMPHIFICKASQGAGAVSLGLLEESRTGGSIRCCGSGCWFRRIARRRPWQGQVESGSAPLR